MRLNITTAAQVGEIVRARRKARRLSQAELATQLGISQSRLSVIEQSPESLTLDRLIALCSVLGLTLALQDTPSREPRAPKPTEPAW